MLGLGAAVAATPADEGPDDDDMDEGGPSGALVKAESSDVVRCLTPCLPVPPASGTHAWLAPRSVGGGRCSPADQPNSPTLCGGARSAPRPLTCGVHATLLAGDAQAEDVPVRQQPGAADQEVRQPDPERA